MTVKKKFLTIIYLFITNCCIFNTINANENHNPFKIDNVYVAADIGTLIDSQSLALDNGAKDALIKLMLHLNAYSQKNDNYINKISSCINDVKSISKLVDNHIIRSERMTSHSYSGYVDFIFDKEKVEDIMNTCGLKYATKPDGETLLLPLVLQGKTYRLVDSESDNLLYDALNAINEEFGLLYLKIMLNKNIFDVNILDPEIFLNGTYKDVLSVLNKYSCTNAIVLLFKHFDKKSALVETKIIRMNTEYHESFKYQILPDETEKMFISRVIYELLKNADLTWKRGLHKNDEMIFSSGVDLEISNPQEWHKVRMILNKIQMIKQYKFKTISNDNIELELKYIGSPEMLSTKLLEHGIIISKRGNTTIMKIIR